MFLIRLWHYLKGYVIIIVNGRSVETFINICTRRQILLWDMERVDQSSVRMKMSIRGFKNARSAARKSRCRVRIRGKKGLPFLLGKYKKRKGFILGLIVFALLIYLMTSIVWSIDITGNYHVKADVLMEQMNEIGIFRGASKRTLDPKYLADILRLKNKELSWVGVEIKGTRLLITVKEGVETPNIIPLEQPCNVVAKNDGIIISIIAKNGLASVKEGDTVKRGQVLISGSLESLYPEFGSKQVHAMGEVMARTWYEIKKEVPKVKLTRMRTGLEWNTYSIYFLDFRVKLPSKKNPFEIYESSIINKAPVIANQFKLPIGVVIEKYYELQEEEQILEQQEARELAQDIANEKIKEFVPKDAEISGRQFQFFEENEYILLTVECTENIATQEEIGGS